MRLNEIRLGHVLSAFSILAVIAILLSAATNQAAFQLFKDYQVSLGWLVALSIAFIAYEGATATARENRRKDEVDRLQKRATHFIRILAEIEGAYTHRLTLMKTSVDLLQGSPNCKATDVARFAKKQDYQCIKAAYDEVGIFNEEIRLRLYKVYSDFRSLQEAIKTDGMIEKPEGMSEARVNSHLARLIFLCERRLNQLTEGILKFIGETGIDPTDFPWVKTQIMNEHFDNLVAALNSHNVSDEQKA
jgi:hypothetical protein